MLPTPSLCLFALGALSIADTDDFGRRICGIADLNGDGTDDLVVADASFGTDRAKFPWELGYGAIWTISGKDGSRIATALGDKEHTGLGGSFFMIGDEICTTINTGKGPALRLFAGKTLQVTRTSSVFERKPGYSAWVISAGDIDRDGVLDAALCIAPNRNEDCVIEIVSGRTLASLKSIHVPFSGWHPLGAITSLGDLNGDGVPEIGVATSYCIFESLSNHVYVFSGKSGERLGQLVGHEGKGGFGAAIGAIGDLDGDGVNELAVVDDYEGAVQIYSGRTREYMHSLEYRWSAPAGIELGNITQLGDIDGDGVRDFGLTIDTFPLGEAHIYSGKSGKALRRHAAREFPDEVYPAFIADVGDLDHDGLGDYAIGTSHHLDSQERGSVTVFSGASGKKLFVVDEHTLTAK